MSRSKKLCRDIVFIVFLFCMSLQEKLCRDIVFIVFLVLQKKLCRDQGLKCRIYRPIFRQYIGYRELTKQFLLQNVVCRKNREKSANIADISAKYWKLTDISVEISTRGRHARGKKF